MLTLLKIFTSSFVIAFSGALMFFGYGLLELVLAIALIGLCAACLVVFSLYFFYSGFQRII